MLKENILNEIVNEYNKYHGTEAQVHILEQKQYDQNRRGLLVQFTGPYCLSCAPEEYHTDFVILLEEKTGLKFEVRSIKQEGNGNIIEYEYVERKPHRV